MKNIFLVVSFFTCLYGCQINSDRERSGATTMEVRADTLKYKLQFPGKEVLYDKVLGALVGSAIGDAMGAPTEMWSRDERQRTYGAIDALDPSFIDPSPEGLWDYHLPPGATTDDTRWKFLIGDFVVKETVSFYQPNGPSAYSFAEHILRAYQKEVSQLKKASATDPVDIEYKVRRLNWLQEWAQVAEPFADKDLERYTTALHRFYGGDLLCAGMLYAPMLGLPYPGDPYQAYQAGFNLGIFDQGYARDITGLTAAMVASALDIEATPSSVMEVFHTVDPHDYLRSRIFGREAFKTYRSAQYIVQTAKQVKICNQERPGHIWNPDSIISCKIETAFQMLDEQNQHSPAHAQEILLVSLTAMLFNDFDFQSSLEFITNYGRDNDTSGAVVGAILGAYSGYEQLPDDLKLQTIQTNKENLGIDLPKLALEISNQISSKLGN